MLLGSSKWNISVSIEGNLFVLDLCKFFASLHLQPEGHSFLLRQLFLENLIDRIFEALSRQQLIITLLTAQIIDKDCLLFVNTPLFKEVVHVVLNILWALVTLNWSLPMEKLIITSRLSFMIINYKLRSHLLCHYVLYRRW